MSNELILIVEDDQNSRILLTDVLGLSGYRTLETDNGEDGLELALRHRPDLVVLDIQLPGMSGIDTFRALRRHPGTSAIPVIAVTASVVGQQHQEVLQEGFDGYERKPISVERFMGTVREILERDSIPPESL